MAKDILDLKKKIEATYSGFGPRGKILTWVALGGVGLWAVKKVKNNVSMTVG